MTEGKKAKLHEILAVLADLEGTAKKVREEAIITFLKKQNHFNGHHKTLKMFEEARKQEEEAAEEHRPLVTTVERKLGYIQKSQIKHYDTVLQQEATNQQAKADLVVDGEVLGENLPATFLLGMESRLKTLRAVFDSIPTLDPSTEWHKRKGNEAGVYTAVYPETSKRDEKAIKHQVLVPPTEQHPAQVEKWTENHTVGMYSVLKESGMISPAEKSQYLEKIDELIQATKKARQRANSTEVVKKSIGKKLFDYIFEG